MANMMAQEKTSFSLGSRLNYAVLCHTMLQEPEVFITQGRSLNKVNRKRKMNKVPLNTVKTSSSAVL